MRSIEQTRTADTRYMRLVLRDGTLIYLAQYTVVKQGRFARAGETFRVYEHDRSVIDREGRLFSGGISLHKAEDVIVGQRIAPGVFEDLFARGLKT